jgi:ammonia channel protein AmtB
VVYPLTVHWCWASGDLGCYTKPDDPSTLEWVECEEGKTTEIVKGDDTLGCYNCTSHGAGWLVNLGYNDFAGSGIVHLLGGLCALVGCYFIGPREGRFTEDGPKKISGHSVPFAALGGFILLFGFLAFNGGSQV